MSNVINIHRSVIRARCGICREPIEWPAGVTERVMQVDPDAPCHHPVIVTESLLQTLDTYTTGPK